MAGEPADGSSRLIRLIYMELVEVKKRNKLKRYEITYAPSLTISQEVVDPYDDWNCENVHGRYFYSPLHNHNKKRTKTVTVDALSKETAKAMFAVRLYNESTNLGIKDGEEPYIFDGIKNIVNIEEVKNGD